jgi:hypothetical protein
VRRSHGRSPSHRRLGLCNIYYYTILRANLIGLEGEGIKEFPGIPLNRELVEAWS